MPEPGHTLLAMERLRALKAWFDRLPWYLDATACILPGVLVMVLCSVIWNWSWSFAACLPFAGAVLGRYGYHRRLGPGYVDERAIPRT